MLLRGRPWAIWPTKGHTETGVEKTSTYRIAGGTSSAAPVVTGVAGLVLSVRPQLTARELKQLLMTSSTRLPSLKREEDPQAFGVWLKYG